MAFGFYYLVGPIMEALIAETLSVSGVAVFFGACFLLEMLQLSHNQQKNF